MIGKLIKGRGAGGLCRYLLGQRDHNGANRPRVELLGGTFTGQTPEELAGEFGQLHDLRPGLGVHVAHQSLRVAEDERPITDDEWRAIGTRWAEGMGFQGYALVGHGDHIHVAASRIRLDGSTVSDAHDWKRSEKIIRDLEIEFGLQRLEASHLLEPEKATTHRKALTIPQVAMAERGIEPAGQIVARLIEARLASGPVSATDFADTLMHAGVKVIPNMASTGKLNGFAYEINGEKVTASTLGRGFTMANLVKRGFNYEPDRDRAFLDSIVSRQKSVELGSAAGKADRDAGRHIEPTGIAGPSEGRDSGRYGQGTDAGRREYGEADRGNQADAGARRQPEPAGTQGSGGSRPEFDQGSTGGSLGSVDINASSVGSNRQDGAVDPGRQKQQAGQPVGSSNLVSADSDARSALARVEVRGVENVTTGERDDRSEEGTRTGHGRHDPRRSIQGADSSGVRPGDDDKAQGRPAGSVGRADGDAANHRSGPGRDPEAPRRDRATSLIAAARISHAMTVSEPARRTLASATAQLAAMTAPPTTPAVERLQAVAGTLPPSGDRTLDQVRAQLRGFGVDAYEVQPIPPKGIELARERIRRWTAEQVEKGLGWLKRMNALGYDVFIRPAAPTEHTAQPFAFVDDITQDVADRMKAEGFPFAVLNESSPGRLHGWVRLADAPMDRDELSRAGRMLADRYGADVNSADWRHYGRLAGTTNRKPSRATPKGPPFVMLRASGGETAPGGESLIAQARQSLENDTRIAERAAAEARAAQQFGGNYMKLGDAVGQFNAARAAAKPARADDGSARDFSGAMSLLRRGYSAEQAAAAIREASPELEKRHADPERYIRQTVERAEARIASTPSTGFRRS